MTWKFSDVREIICALNPEASPETVESRIKQWQRLGIPTGVNVGRGTRCEYSDAMLWQTALLNALQNMGVPPTAGKEMLPQLETADVITTPHGCVTVDKERIAKAIEARRAETGTGSVHDSAGRQASSEKRTKGLPAPGQPTPEELALARKIVAENIEVWGWGPLEEIEDLAEHTLAVQAALSAIQQTTELAARYFEPTGDIWTYEGARDLGVSAALRRNDHLGDV